MTCPWCKYTQNIGVQKISQKPVKVTKLTRLIRRLPKLVQLTKSISQDLVTLTGFWLIFWTPIFCVDTI